MLFAESLLTLVGLSHVRFDDDDDVLRMQEKRGQQQQQQQKRRGASRVRYQVFTI